MKFTPLSMMLSCDSIFFGCDLQLIESRTSALRRRYRTIGNCRKLHKKGRYASLSLVMALILAKIN